MAKTSNKTIIKVFFGSAARTNQPLPPDNTKLNIKYEKQINKSL